MRAAEGINEQTFRNLPLVEMGQRREAAYINDTHLFHHCTLIFFVFTYFILFFSRQPHLIGPFLLLHDMHLRSHNSYLLA